MTIYSKIPAIWKRSSEKPHPVLFGEYNSPEVEYLKDCQWFFTEKIDGTNIRVEWDGYDIRFKGRSDNAQIPTKLFSFLQDTFDSKMEELFEEQFGQEPAVLYGEGFGAGIQKGGGLYRPEPGFILFDVKVGDPSEKDWWLDRGNVLDVACNLDLDFVPVALHGRIQDALTYMSRRPQSIIALEEKEAEGVVGQPVIPMFNRKGERVIVKIKPEHVEYMQMEAY